MFKNCKGSALIAFAGSAGSGKDEALKALRLSGANPFGGSWAHFRFADPLKEAVAAMFEVNVDSIEKRKDEAFDHLPGRPTPRDFLKVIGAAVRNQIHEDTWVGFLREELNWAAEVRVAQKDVAIITDCRYENEVEMVHRLGGQVVGIRRIHASDGSAFTPRSANHESERGLGDELLDWEIVNEGTNLQDFHRQVVAGVTESLGRLK